MRALCRPAPGRPGIDLAIAMWVSLSANARWNLLGWGFRPSTLTMRAYELVRRMP